MRSECGLENWLTGIKDHHLHLRALVLEPELDLERLQPQLPAQLLALLVVRVWTLLEETGNPSISERNEMSIFCESYMNQCSRKNMEWRSKGSSSVCECYIYSPTSWMLCFLICFCAEKRTKEQKRFGSTYTILPEESGHEQELFNWTAWTQAYISSLSECYYPLSSPH
jgi:hypothetical protein